LEVRKQAGAMEDKKPWIEPEIEEVAQESEDEVLASCYTLSMSKRSGGSGCRSSRCDTYP
jgi:uncharacterized Fe-S cluster protein YjdI